MDLPRGTASPVATALTAPVDCATGDATGSWDAATIRTRVAPKGTLELSWRTERAWTGCRSLALMFTGADWEGPTAVFGPVAF